MCSIVLFIGLFVLGIVTLVRGRFDFSPTKVAQGAPAYIAGVILLLPFPLALGVGLIIGIVFATRGRFLVPEDQLWLGLVEVGISLGCLGLALLICLLNAKNPYDRKRARRDRDWDDDEEEDDYPPRRRRARIEDDPDEEAPPPRPPRGPSDRGDDRFRE